MDTGIEGGTMRGVKTIGIVLLVAVLATAMSGCMVFGRSVLTSVNVEPKYVGTWTYYGLYFAQISFKVTNTGLLDLSDVHVYFRVTTESGSTFTDFTIVGPIDVGDTLAATYDIQTDGAKVVKIEVVDTQRFLN
jgi:hypothetical protein